jgi:hypothetical protein
MDRNLQPRRQPEAFWILGTSGQRGSQRRFHFGNADRPGNKRQRHHCTRGIAGGSVPGRAESTGSIWPLHEDQKMKLRVYIDQRIGEEIFPGLPYFRAPPRNYRAQSLPAADMERYHVLSNPPPTSISRLRSSRSTTFAGARLRSCQSYTVEPDPRHPATIPACIRYNRGDLNIGYPCTVYVFERSPYVNHRRLIVVGNQRVTKILYETVTEPGGRCRRSCEDQKEKTVKTKKEKTVKTNRQMENQANRIADAIVDLVERNNGPVTFARIGREIPGFAKNEPPAWEYFLERDDGESVIWNGMTEAGLTALRKVMSERRVAVQYVNSLPYIQEDHFITDERWLQIVLLPARAANLDTPRWHVRCSPAYRDYCIAAPGHRPLTPTPVRYTADQFSF